MKGRVGMNIYSSDLIFLREAAIDLREYILSPDLYWPVRTISDEVKLPQLTIGNILFSQARLGAAVLDSTQYAESVSISQQIDQVRSEWLANWRIKAGYEFGSRLRLWAQALQELRSDRQKRAHHYSNEVRLRAILTLLQGDGQAEIAPQDVEQLQSIDQVLRGITDPANFVWEAEFAKVFPSDKFWFLYVSLVTLQ